MAIKRSIPLGIELVKRGVVKESDISEALEYQKTHTRKKLGDIIDILKLCPEDKLLKAMSEIFNEEFIGINRNSLKVNMTDYISLDIAKDNKVVLFDINGNRAKVCFADTSNLNAVDQIKSLLLHRGLVVEKYMSFENRIMSVIKQLEGKATEKISDVGSDITGLVDTIIKSAMEKRASDIHVEPMENSVRVRFRIDGVLVTVATIEKNKQSQLIGRLKAISNMHQEKQEAQDGRIILYDDYNIRVSSQKNIYGEKFVLRLLKKNTGIQNIFDLGFPNDEKILKTCFDKRNSVTVIAAPTGEGKTTTLYSVIDYLNKPDLNITTVEDPVEIRLEGINQIEIDPKTTFAGSLRTILRQDPNIILVGEIRDNETAEIAMQAGQTGHYVLSTIHTIDAIEVITRLRKMGIPDYDIASTLATSVSQRLIRKPCPHCSTPRNFTEHEKNTMNKLVEPFGIKYDFKDKKTFDIVGCKQCNYTGYLGRTGVFEICEITEEIKELISKGESSIKIKTQAIKEGYKPLFIDALNKVYNEELTLDEVNSKLLLFN